jgi:hypothetical protein
MTPSWHVALFLLVPDHVHALLAFKRDGSMSRVIGDWKHFHARKNRIEWQEGFFDHRLRDDERGEKLQAKVNYIRQNPVVAGLCASAEEWPWVIDRSSQLLVEASSKGLLDPPARSGKRLLERLSFICHALQILAIFAFGQSID